MFSRDAWEWLAVRVVPEHSFYTELWKSSVEQFIQKNTPQSDVLPLEQTGPLNTPQSVVFTGSQYIFTGSQYTYTMQSSYLWKRRRSFCYRWHYRFQRWIDLLTQVVSQTLQIHK